MSVVDAALGVLLGAIPHLNPLKIGPETTLMSDGRCEVQSHCATREKFSRPNKWIQEKENDQENKIRDGSQNSMEAIFF